MGLLALSACADGPGTEKAASSARVCPDCSPVEVGKSSGSTAASLAPCALAYLERNVAAAEAEELGFPVTPAAALIERPIDTPMQWVTKRTEGGGPATGYQRETRVRGAFHVETYNYRWLDPERCDGKVCKIDGVSGEQSPCPERVIMMQVSGELETLDGALQVRFPRQAVNIREPGETDDLVVAAAADLSEARGSLLIDPEVPPPRVGRLDLSLQFADSHQRAYGVLSLGVTPDWENLPQDAGLKIPSRLAYYTPIEAQWGEPPSGAASTAGP